jgi:tRNA(fMet)-specific endonuclease VapC
MRDTHPQVMQRLTSEAIADVCTSVVCMGELWHGLSRKTPSKAAAQLESRLDELLAHLVVLPLNIGVGKVYGELFTKLESTGQVIGANDLWIAAHAKAVDVTLVTNNTREFERVKGLKLENWSEV